MHSPAALRWQSHSFSVDVEAEHDQWNASQHGTDLRVTATYLCHGFPAAPDIFIGPIMGEVVHTD